MRYEEARTHEGRRCRVGYTDLARTGPRRSYEATPGRSTTGTVRVYGKAVAVDDERGRMIEMIALGLVDSIEEIDPATVRAGA